MGSLHRGYLDSQCLQSGRTGSTSDVGGRLQGRLVWQEDACSLLDLEGLGGAGNSSGLCLGVGGNNFLRFCRLLRGLP